MFREEDIKLGELLLKEGIINAEQLQSVLSVQRQEGGRLGSIFVRLGLVKEEQLMVVLSKQLGIPYFSFGKGMLKPAAGQSLEYLLPRDFAVNNSVLILSRTLKSLTVAMADPLDFILIDNLKTMTGCQINPVIATKSDIQKAINEFYADPAILKEPGQVPYGVDSSFISSAEAARSVVGELNLDKLAASAEEAPVVKLVDLIIRQAIDERASDIHIDPFKDKISLRYRIDGKLYEIPSPAKHLHLPIVARIKILAKLDIAESRLPQEGAILVKIENRPIDIRVSTIPTVYGEKIVLQILDRSRVNLDLSQLGFEQRQLEQIRQAINSSYGLIFLSGPAGSGKTTTLYAMLNEIKSPSKNIVTIEDPVEYRIEGVNQVQVDPGVGLTFTASLRSFLKQDPDVMLVGEMRDLEEAEICARLAMTGHLVLSALHTNDAPGVLYRLIDIGVAPYLLSPSLRLVIAQRLLRKLCPDCKEAYEPQLEQLGNIQLKAELIYRPVGCMKCNQTGYKGRVCIAEILKINALLQDLIYRKAPYQKLKEAARSAGMQTLYQSAIRKVEGGITSLEEVLSLSLDTDY